MGRGIRRRIQRWWAHRRCPLSQLSWLRPRYAHGPSGVHSTKPELARSPPELRGAPDGARGAERAERVRADDVLVRDERDERPARPVVRAPCPAERVCGGVVRDVSDIYMYIFNHGSRVGLKLACCERVFFARCVFGFWPKVVYHSNFIACVCVRRLIPLAIVGAKDFYSTFVDLFSEFLSSTVCNLHTLLTYSAYV